MKATSAAQHNSVVSLFNEGYSQRQIKAKTGLGKGTISRISKEVDGNKENHFNNCCPDFDLNVTLLEGVKAVRNRLPKNITWKCSEEEYSLFIQQGMAVSRSNE